jgi:DNA-binding NarL/FixJ family response regulator
LLSILNMKRARSHSIAILSDHPLFREGLVELLRTKGFESVFEHETSRDLLDASRSRAPEVLILDLDHEKEDTMSLVRLFRAELPKTHLVLIGTPLRQEAAAPSKDEGALETPAGNAAALAAVASFVKLPRSRERRRVHEQWRMVTPRRRDVLRWLATGIDNQAIACKLRVSERAIKAHISMLLQIFGAQNRTQLALIADHAGLRPPLAITATKSLPCAPGRCRISTQDA